jgi:pimeloyl-ACP methyl ester carboxylesterase
LPLQQLGNPTSARQVMPRTEPLMAQSEQQDHLVWRSVEVDGRRANYGVAGDGLQVLFVHGWALGHHAYKRALQRLVRLGCRVYAPALPGFGGSAALASGQDDLQGYAAWVDAFLERVGVAEPVLAVGHSFGGGVATQLAHDFPDRVGYLVLINSVGGGTWLQADSKMRSMAERPLWSWAINFFFDILPDLRVATTLRAVLEDAVPNLIRNPIGVWRVGSLARRAHLTAELADLRARRLQVLVLWGEDDRIIPWASFEALRAAVGSAGEVVPGRHAWLLADPDSFGEVMVNSVTLARGARVLVEPGQIAALRPSDATDAVAR